MLVPVIHGVITKFFAACPLGLALVAGGSGFGIFRLTLGSGLARFVITAGAVVVFGNAGGSGRIELITVGTFRNFAFFGGATTCGLIFAIRTIFKRLDMKRGRVCGTVKRITVAIDFSAALITVVAIGYGQSTAIWISGNAGTDIVFRDGVFIRTALGTEILYT